MQLVRLLKPTLPVIVRAVDERGVERLRNLGATEVIPEVLEGSLIMAARTLTQLGVPPERAQAYLDEARASHYAPLRELYGETPEEFIGTGLDAEPTVIADVEARPPEA